MNARERVLRAINHQEPDRVPIDLGSVESTGIAAMAYHALTEYLGLDGGGRVRVSDVFQMLADVELEILDRLHVDTVNVPMLKLSFGSHYGRWRPWELFDGTPVLVPEDFQFVGDGKGGYLAINGGLPVARMPRDGYYFDTIEKVEGLDPVIRGRHSLGGTLPDPKEARYPLLTDEELAFLEQQVRLLYEDTDKALMGNPHLNITEIGSFEDWFILLVTEPGYVADCYAEQADSIITNLGLFYQAAGDRLVATYFGQDFGTQRGEMISPGTFREVMAPPYRTIFRWVHDNTSWKVFFHSCGSIYRILPDLVDIGVDILNPVQTGAARMDPGTLKREFGDRLVFWGGGIDVQQLPFMSVEEVRAQVRDRIRTFASGGGFVFCPTHNIQAGTPAENVVAAYDTAYEWGSYGFDS
jgi:uroporphyrinogen decarboxylase